MGFAVLPVSRNELTAGRRTWRGFFRMSIGSVARMSFGLEPFPKLRSAWHALGNHIAQADLAFMNRDVRLGGQFKKIVGGTAWKRPGSAEMKGHKDLVHQLCLEPHWANTT